MAKARKEIDKDSMYQKIMPSAMRSVQPVEDGSEAEAAPAPAKKAPARSTPRKAPAKTAPVPAEVPEDTATAEAEAPARTPATAAAPPASRKPAAAPVPEAKPNIVNIMELLIDEKMDLAMEKFHCCGCDRCRQDIAAMALNKLHPKYIVAEPEQLDAGMADKESNTQVTTALVQAILKVKANPKH